ncbi:MAG: terminase family protein [Dongiaceae bacterium]
MAASVQSGPSVIRLPYRPRPLQRALHERMRRFNVLVCHRRFGKTVLCINHLIRAAATCERERPRYAYLAPLYKQAKAAAWDYLKHFSAPIPEIRKHETELRVDLPNGARIALLGADNPDALRGIYLDGVVLDEYAQMSPRAFTEIIRPALADREGWAIFIGTPRGRNAFYELHRMASDLTERGDPDWQTALYPASATGVLPEAELAAARQVMSEAEYAQEFECSFQAAIVGAYYGDLIAAAERESRIGRVPWEPRLPVHTAWDLGIGDATAIWFCQAVGTEIRLIDYYEASGVGLDHYAKRLGERPYVYGDHFLPHDAAVRELGSGRSRIETLQSLGIRAKIVRNLSLEDGINAARLTLPRCWFDRDKATRGIEALRQYRRDRDLKSGVWRLRPLHDWTSNAADAFRYLALALPDPLKRAGLRPLAEADYDPFAW